MKLLSLNVGLPRDVAWRGRTVRTAIFKSPVDGRRRVRRLNVDGDGQADLVGHGGEHRAVYVYDRSAYEHWTEVLGREDLAPGHFGENFTVEGMPDDEVCIGDRFRIGDATFEVTQPRVTCFKVGLRRALAIPALSAGWRGSFEALLEQNERGAAGNEGLARPSAPPAWPGLRPFRVSAASHESASVRSLNLEPVDGEPLPSFL